MIDESRFHLGTLCAQGHDYQGTGKSLRYNRPVNCVECAKAYRRARDAAAKAERDALKPKFPDGMKPCASCRSLVNIGTVRCKPCARDQQKEIRDRNIERTKAYEKGKRAARREHSWHLVLWEGSKSSARARRLEHSISRGDILELWKKQSGRCYFTGVDMIPSQEVRHPQRPSIDRLDSSKGYMPGNVVLSCMLINMGRGRASADETFAIIGKIAAAFGGH